MCCVVVFCCLACAIAFRDESISWRYTHAGGVLSASAILIFISVYSIVCVCVCVGCMFSPVRRLLLLSASAEAGGQAPNKRQGSDLRKATKKRTVEWDSSNKTKQSKKKFAGAEKIIGSTQWWPRVDSKDYIIVYRGRSRNRKSRAGSGPGAGPGLEFNVVLISPINLIPNARAPCGSAALRKSAYE